MKKIRAAFVDNDYAMHKIIKDLSTKSNLVEIVKTFLCPHRFLDEQSTLECDFFMLEISFSEINGLHVAKQLKGRPFIFVTGTSEIELMKEAISLSPIDILTKPMVPERFNKAVEKAQRLINSVQRKEFHENEFVLYNVAEFRGKTMIKPDEIICIVTDERDHRDKKAYLKDGKVLTIKRCSLEQLLNSSSRLVRVNKSELVSLDVIQNIECDMITLKGVTGNKGPKQVTLGYTYIKDLKNRLQTTLV